VACIVVYKTDRLSRSLMDFARIMEVLDRRGVTAANVDMIAEGATDTPAALTLGFPVKRAGLGGI